MVLNPPDFPSPETRNALLDHAAAEIGIDLTVIGSMRSFSQSVVGDPLAPYEPVERLGLEDAHSLLIMFSTYH